MLTCVEDLEAFRFEVEKYIDVLLPLEYLQRSKVVVCRHKKTGIFFGGYVIVKEGALRVLESIPEFDVSKVSVDLSNVAEITGLWLDPTKADTKFASFLFWLKLYTDLAFSRFDGFVYAYTLKKKNLQKIYGTFMPTVLFSGMTKKLIGMSEAEEESVEFIPKKRVVFAPVRHFSFVGRRLRMAFRAVYRRTFPGFIPRPFSLLNFLFKSWL